MCVKSAVESRAERFKDCKKKYRLDDDSCHVMTEASVASDPIALCNDQQEAALREWKRLYPRQAAEEAQRQDERQRQRDEKGLLRQQGR
jgi:hypothetical protein